METNSPKVGMGLRSSQKNQEVHQDDRIKEAIRAIELGGTFRAIAARFGLSKTLLKR